jgi:hypothetical protein
MQGQTRTERELLDARVMVGDLVPAGSVFAFLAEHRHELFCGFVHRGPVPVADGAAVAAGGSGRVGAGAQGAV